MRPEEIIPRGQNFAVVGHLYRPVEAIKPLGLLLASLPVDPDQPAVTTGASFQLQYRASFLLPHQRAAWLR
jgi:hypothetical protein